MGGADGILRSWDDVDWTTLLLYPTHPATPPGSISTGLSLDSSLNKNLA